MSKSKLRRDADLLLHRGTRTEEAYPASRARRPAEVQRLIGAIGSLMLADGTPMMEKFVAGKIFHLLQQPGAVSTRPATTLKLVPQLQFALRQIASKGKAFAEVAAAINDVAKNLDWVSSKTGPFASMNIETAHAHAIIAGTSGLEEREDVTLGLTIMEPYSRFPRDARPDDHGALQPLPRSRAVSRPRVPGALRLRIPLRRPRLAAGHAGLRFL